MSSCSVILSCEHGGNRIPPAYWRLFDKHRKLLDSHRGLDIGSLGMARYLAKSLSAPLHEATVSRLLVDLNRSGHHPQIFSRISRTLPADQRQAILKKYYFPHRDGIETAIRKRLSAARLIVHIAVHSFTPRYDGVVRNADIGLLYDPSRRRERRFCLDWKRHLIQRAPRLRVRCNYPYKGTADGLTTALRKLFPGNRYLGIELEINQQWVTGKPEKWQRLESIISETLLDTRELT